MKCITLSVWFFILIYMNRSSIICREQRLYCIYNSIRQSFNLPVILFPFHCSSSQPVIPSFNSKSKSPRWRHRQESWRSFCSSPCPHLLSLVTPLLSIVLPACSYCRPLRHHQHRALRTHRIPHIHIQSPRRQTHLAMATVAAMTPRPDRSLPPHFSLHAPAGHKAQQATKPSTGNPSTSPEYF